MGRPFSPQFIVEQLDRFVVGQERAKKDLAILGFYQAMRQQLDKQRYEDIVEEMWEKQYPNASDTQEVQVSYNADGSVAGYGVTEPKYKQIESIQKKYDVFDHLQKEEPSLPGKAGLILGPSGCGKTYLVTLLGKILDLPVVYVNAMELTNTGYVGRTISDICDDELRSLARTHEFGPWQMPYAIIFVDEFDKRCVSADERSWDRAIQYSLLAGLEGKTMSDTSSKGSSSVETKRMLWILGGSFQHLRDIKHKTSTTIGYTGNIDPSKDDFHVYSAADLEEGGIIKEVAGRLPVVTEVIQLTREQMRDALKKENNSIKPYEDLYNFLGKQFLPTEEQIERIIDKCMESKTGARGLSFAIHEVFKEDLLDLEYPIK